MAAVIQERPYEIIFSAGPSRYVIQSDLPFNTAGLVIEIKLFFKYLGDSDYREIFAQPAYHDKLGKVSFYPAAILDSMLTWQLPSLYVSIHRMGSQTGKYYIAYREITNGNLNPEWIHDLANERFVLKGGLAYERGEGPNFFASYLPIHKPFLTWQQSGRLCGLTERMYLSFFMHREPNGDVLVKYFIKYTDGTDGQSLLMITNPAKFGVTSIPTGILQMELNEIDPGRKIWYYEVSVQDDGGILAMPFRYFLDNRNSYNDTQFNFHNSIGGFDSIRILGVVEQDLKRSINTASITTELDVTPEIVVPREFVQNIAASRTYKANAGYFGRKEEESLRDVFFSKSVWHCKYSRWWPVLVTEDTVKLPSSNDKLFTLPLEWKYGWSNSSYTPEFIDV